MEYINLWQPLLLIVVTLFIGMALGTFYMYRRMRVDNDLLQIDLDLAHEKLHELAGDYSSVLTERDNAKKKVKEPATKLDETFKQQLRNKDDELDRTQASYNSLKELNKGQDKSLEIAASQILILENRIAINKKVAIEREGELNIAISKITDQLEQIEELEKDSKKFTEDKQISSDDEIQNLTIAVKKRDNKIERLDKRILELESEGDDGNRLGGGVQNWKRIK